MSKRSRLRFDDIDDTPHPTDPPTTRGPSPNQSAAPVEDDDDDENRWSSYCDALHGPQPPPRWVITSAGAIDDDLGVMKSGKEADVSLLRRIHGDRENLLAVKRYRDAEHRMFHRDAAYLEGRKEKKSRERRAMQTRTGFGRGLIASRWASAEFAVLSGLWLAGAAVPYPVQLLGSELMMEFIGTDDGVAAPRLAQLRPSAHEAAHLYDQMRGVLVRLAEAGYAHGDLSPYNVLVHDGRLILIDLPQAVDLVGNPQGFDFLRRDCENICGWFAARDADANARELYDELMRAAL